MIYAISDIHGYYDKLIKVLSKVDLECDNRLIFLGDYIDYGKDSFKVLDHIHNLEKRYGKEKVIVLRGNHEDAFITWINEYKVMNTSRMRDVLMYNDWFRNELETGAKTFRTFVTPQEMDRLNEMAQTGSSYEINFTAVKLLLSKHKALISWLSRLPCYYETDKCIFVHAGIDEEADDLWAVGTLKEMFLYKYPPSVGSFYKYIIAGHIGTDNEKLANDPLFHDIFYDGQSHIYIDGSVYKEGGKINLLYMEEDDPTSYISK